MKKITSKYLLVFILLFTLILRAYQIWYPTGYVFDEVYHAFTAKEYLTGSKDAWEWWTTPPPGVAYEWTHPPLAKEIMTASMFLIGSNDSWAWRTPGILFGTLSVYLVFLLAQALFKNKNISLISAFAFSIDGLNFVQSRTGMNDIYFVTFMLACIYLLITKRFLLSALLLGCAISTKWTGIYLYGLVFLLLLVTKQLKNIFYYALIPPLIYLASYTPFFYLGHTKEQLIELQRQMWWYHSHLKATHDYTSPWWSWPLNLYPVWYFVDYQKNTLSNIFTSGNPAVFWSGAIALLFTMKEFLLGKIKKMPKIPYLGLFIVIAGYLVFWLPWALSPRIMFLYHYSPSIPFLCIALGYQLEKLMHNKLERWWLLFILGALLIVFLLIYPILIGLPLPKHILLLFFRTNLTKNPFGWN